MGFTPLEGLVMATRSGNVDPGLIVWLLRHGGLSVDEVSDGLEYSGGLAGLADLPGGSGDLRDVRSAADRGDPGARLALEVHAHRLRAQIAAMAAALGGLDTLVFTGGIGEHQAQTRAEAASGLGFLGVAVDEGRNATAQPDCDISAPARRSAPWSSPHARTSRSPARPAPCSPGPSRMPGVPWLAPVQAAAGDPGGRDPDGLLPRPGWPGLDARRQHRGSLGVGAHVVCRAMDQDAPARAGRFVDVVDLERDLVLGVSYPGLEILSRGAVRCGAEHDRALMHPVVDREDAQAVPAQVRKPADAARRDQPEALRLIQRLQGVVRIAARGIRHCDSFHDPEGDPRSWVTPGSEAPGPLGTDVSPCRIPVREPAPLKHPPRRGRQAQQQDPQRNRGESGCPNLAGQDRTVAHRRAGRRPRLVHPQRHHLASGQSDADQDVTRPHPVGLEYTIGTATCVFSQQHEAPQAAIWYSCVSPPRTCFRQIRYSARLICGGRVSA